MSSQDIKAAILSARDGALIRWGNCLVYPLMLVDRPITVYLPKNWRQLYNPFAKAAAEQLIKEGKRVREVTFEQFMAEWELIEGKAGRW